MQKRLSSKGCGRKSSDDKIYFTFGFTLFPKNYWRKRTVLKIGFKSSSKILLSRAFWLIMKRMCWQVFALSFFVLIWTFSRLVEIDCTDYPLKALHLFATSVYDSQVFKKEVGTKWAVPKKSSFMPSPQLSELV